MYLYQITLSLTNIFLKRKRINFESIGINDNKYKKSIKKREIPINKYAQIYINHIYISPSFKIQKENKERRFIQKFWARRKISLKAKRNSKKQSNILIDIIKIFQQVFLLSALPLHIFKVCYHSKFEYIQFSTINNQVPHVQRMDIFQLIGDFLHLIAVLMLLLKIIANKNVIGLSYRTQQIFLAVFVSRYLDLFLGWKTLYAFVMKIIFISLTAYTIYLMKIKKPYNLSLDRQSDAFPHYYIYGAALVAAIIVHKSFNPIDFLWSFSIWLEALAILPQLFMIYKLKDIQNITAHYVLFLGLYRGFYIFHWIFHWQHVVWTSFIAGIIQTVLYADFIYFFIKSNQQERIMSFPV